MSEGILSRGAGLESHSTVKPKRLQVWERA